MGESERPSGPAWPAVGEAEGRPPALRHGGRSRRSGDDGGDDRDERDEPRTRRSRGDAPPLELTVGPRVFTRSLAYHHDLFGALRPYTVGPAVSGAAQIDWYPAGHLTSGPLSWLGVSLRAEQAVALTSEAAGGTEYPTSSRALSANVRLRIPIDRSDLGLTAGYGVHEYAVDDVSRVAQKPDIPSVDYRYVRLGASGRLALSRRMSFLASFGYLVVLDSGELGSEQWFPRSEGAGVEVGMALTHHLVADLEVQLSLEMRRYFFSFHPEPGDPWIAGGATDTYFVAGASLAYRMGSGAGR